MRTRNPSTWALVVGGLLVALSLAFFVSRYASSSPDGLNKVAIDKGFADQEKESATADSPLAGYGVEGVENEGLSTGLSGIIGVAICFGAGMLLFVIFGGRKRTAHGEGDAAAATSSSGSAP